MCRNRIKYYVYKRSGKWLGTNVQAKNMIRILEAQMNLINSLTAKVAKFLHTKFENQKFITINLLKKYFTTDKWVKNGPFYSSAIWLMAILIFDGMLDLYTKFHKPVVCKTTVTQILLKIQSLK